jgi:hypothetical protein
MNDRMAKYKADPKGVLENSIIEKYGQKGLDVWKKSEEFSMIRAAIKHLLSKNTSRAYKSKYFKRQLS